MRSGSTDDFVRRGASAGPKSSVRATSGSIAVSMSKLFPPCDSKSKSGILCGLSAFWPVPRLRGGVRGRARSLSVELRGSDDPPEVNSGLVNPMLGKAKGKVAPNTWVYVGTRRCQFSDYVSILAQNYLQSDWSFEAKHRSRVRGQEQASD